MSRLSFCSLVAIVTVACYSTCGHTKATVAKRATDKGCGTDVADEVIFYYSSTADPVPKQLKAHDNANVTALTFKAADPIVFITHGYLENSHHPSCELIRRAYLEGTTPVNLIVVDWSFTNKGLLSTAKNQMEAVGKEIADLVNLMVNKTKMDVTKATLVGHSLGAHVMGIAGRKLKAQVPHMFGLDPTPVILINPEKLRLSSTAAKNVQVIHAYSYGESKVLGHADFYANGPKNQPSCSLGTCTHGHAYEYFAESLNTKNPFKAQLCGDNNKPSRDCNGREEIVGGRTPKAHLSGKYYFETNAEPPYAIREPRPKEDSFTVKILRMTNNLITKMRNGWQMVYGK